MPPCVPGCTPPWVYASLYTLPGTPWVHHHPVHPGRMQHPRARGCCRSPGLKEAKTPGWRIFPRLGPRKVSAFLWPARADPSRAHARRMDRSDRRRVFLGAERLGTASGAEGSHPARGIRRARDARRHPGSVALINLIEARGPPRAKKGLGHGPRPVPREVSL